MNKLAKYLEEKNIKPNALARLTGNYRRNADIAKWAKTGQSLLKLNGEVLISLARALNMSVEELLMDYEADGTLGYIRQLELGVNMVRNVSGFEGDGSFEYILGFGNSLYFNCRDAERVMESSNLIPTTRHMGKGVVQDTDSLVEEMKAFGKRSEDLQDYYAFYEERRNPAIVTYKSDEDKQNLTFGIFRTNSLKGVPEKVEVLKAVWTDTELDTYADVIFKDFADYDSLVENHPVSKVEFFDLFGKIMNSIKVDKMKK